MIVTNLMIKLKKSKLKLSFHREIVIIVLGSVFGTVLPARCYKSSFLLFISVVGLYRIKRSRHG